MYDTFECCAWGDFLLHTEETGERIYPDLCDCVCHWEDDGEI